MILYCVLIRKHGQFPLFTLETEGYGKEIACD